MSSHYTNSSSQCKQQVIIPRDYTRRIVVALTQVFMRAVRGFAWEDGARRAEGEEPGGRRGGARRADDGHVRARAGGERVRRQLVLLRAPSCAGSTFYCNASLLVIKRHASGQRFISKNSYFIGQVWGHIFSTHGIPDTMDKEQVRAIVRR